MPYRIIDMGICKPFFFVLLLVAALIFCGCTTLPKVSQVVEEAQGAQEPPRILSAKGYLSPQQSKALLERLKRSVEPTDLLERHLAVIESVSGNPLIKGNKVRLLIDGPATYAAMFRAVKNAKDHVNIETYIFEGEEIGGKFADLLLQKQSEGVQVNIIYDSYGSSGTPDSFFERLRDGGINVVVFNPVNPLKVVGKERFIHRDHRKILIVDGGLAITGGVNISQVYSSRLSGEEREGKKQLPWRDTDVQIEGPAVAEFQKLFLDTWGRQKGPALAQQNFFPQLKERGKDLVQVVGNVPGEENRTTFIMYVSAISFAANSVHLTNAYFAPENQTVEALVDTAGRGVDVKIIVPGTSDSPLALLAGQYYYSDLLKAGVKLYQRRNAMLHAKTAVIDSVWATVGSTNLDFWSFARNDEVNAVILSSEFAAEMETLFARDLAESDEIKREEWEQRPLFPRLKELIAHLFRRWL